MTASNDTIVVLGWFADHIHLFGWPALLVFVWRASSFFTKLGVRAMGAEAHIQKMATNCFPTMQASLQNQDILLKSIDASLKHIADKN
jgi:hypothetical protein